jgi:hypothetical protein
MLLVLFVKEGSAPQAVVPVSVNVAGSALCWSRLCPTRQHWICRNIGLHWRGEAVLSASKVTLLSNFVVIWKKIFKILAETEWSGGLLWWRWWTFGFLTGQHIFIRRGLCIAGISYFIYWRFLNCVGCIESNEDNCEWWTVKDAEEEVAAYFNILSHHIRWGTDENH